MDSINQNLQNPEWWFTGIFFIVIGFAISKLLNGFPQLLKSMARTLRKKNLQKIKNIRYNSYDIQYQITSENRYFLGFVIIGSLYLLIFFLSPFRVLLKEHFWFVMMLTTPLYIAEIMWLNKKAFIQSLIKSASKLLPRKPSALTRKKEKEFSYSSYKKQKKRGGYAYVQKKKYI